MKRVIPTLGLASLLLAFPSACGRDEQPVVEAPKPEVTLPAPEVETTTPYKLRDGDYLSKLAVRKMGLSGHSAIYGWVKCTQEATWTPEEIRRGDDMSVVNGRVVREGDGYMDNIGGPGTHVNFCK